MRRRTPRPPVVHLTNYSWGTFCAGSHSSSALVESRPERVTCKRCLVKMRTLVAKHGKDALR